MAAPAATLKKLAGRRAGADEQHVDARWRKLRPQGVGKPVQGELARAVLALFRHGAVAEHRADIDDDRPLARSQQRQRFADELGRREEIDLHHLPQPGFVGLVEPAQRADAGVVDERIQAAEFASGQFECRRAVVAPRHIAGEPAQIARGAATARLPAPAAAPRGGPGRRPSRRWRISSIDQRPADAAGRAGHDRSQAGDAPPRHGSGDVFDRRWQRAAAVAGDASERARAAETRALLVQRAEVPLRKPDVNEHAVVVDSCRSRTSPCAAR